MEQIAGTGAEAAAAGADHAVLMIHEFLIDERPEEKKSKHVADLQHFGETVLTCETPDDLERRHCPATLTGRTVPVENDLRRWDS
jgi:hypothetical protein